MDQTPSLQSTPPKIDVPSVNIRLPMKDVKQIKAYWAMLSGKPYNSLDAELNHFWQQQQICNQQMNLSGKVDPTLLPHVADSAFIMLPLNISYGINIKLGNKAFINANATLQDNAVITIGSQTMLGPNVQIYTASHPLDAEERCRGIETAKAVNIGDRVWIGGGAIILPGVKIGHEAVIGAGSVVTKDVKPKHVVAGNPARVIKVLSSC